MLGVALAVPTPKKAGSFCGLLGWRRRALQRQGQRGEPACCRRAVPAGAKPARPLLAPALMPDAPAALADLAAPCRARCAPPRLPSRLSDFLLPEVLQQPGYDADAVEGEEDPDAQFSDDEAVGFGGS